MVRWLLGVKNNQSKSGNSTLRMLTAILHSDGDLTEQGKMRWATKPARLDSVEGSSSCPTTMIFLVPDVLLSSLSKPDMSRLRLAAACALLKLAQEPCYHEIITLEQYQLCSLVINVRAPPSSSAAPGACFRSPLSSCPGRVLPGATVFLPEAPPGVVSPAFASGIHGRVRSVCQGPRKGAEGPRSPVFGEECEHPQRVPETARRPQW